MANNRSVCPMDGKIHRHYSHRYFLNSFEKDGKLHPYHCIPCGFRHIAEFVPEKEFILFTDSTLHEADKFLREPPNLFHLSMESICGGTVTNLKNSWEMLYKHHVTHITHICSLAGLNDLLSGVSPQNIIGEYYNWHSLIKEENSQNSLTIFKLPLPPKLAWFPANGPFPTANYVNKLSELELLNKSIDTFNRVNSPFQETPVVGFDEKGI